jgi:pimeloyl-ACP methyl ester carboxylesterase
MPEGAWTPASPATVATGALARVRRALRLSERLHPAVAAWLAARLFTSPRRHRAPEREAEALRTAAPFVIRSGGARLAAWSWGSGPAVLLVHGWEGRGAQLAAVVPPLVAAGRRVVALDGPAHGRSPGRTLTLPAFAAALLDAEQALGGLHGVMAHSFGAASASYALCRGLSPRRLAYVAGASGAEGALTRFEAMLQPSSRVLERMKAGLERDTGVRLSDVDTRALATRHGQPPLLLVHDAQDQEVPIEEARAVADLWPDAELVVTEGLGHRRILRDPAVADRVARFLA